MSEISKPRNIILAGIIILAVIARLIFISSNDYFYDDAYITLRYAQNIFHGDGFVYNYGEYVYGASSPLYTLMMAAVSAVASDQILPLAARCIGCIGLLAVVFVLWKFLQLTTLAKFVMAIGLVSYPRIFYSSIGGMEECFILLLMGLSFAAAMRHSRFWLGIVIALLFVTKVDTLAWVACLLVGETLSKKRVPWEPVVVALLFSLPWIVYSAYTFGSVFPHTIEAKQVAHVQMDGFHLYDALLLAVPDGFKDNLWLAMLFGVFAYGSLGICLWSVVRTKDWRFLVFPLYCVAYIMALFASGTPLGLWNRWTVPVWGALIVSFSYVVNSLDARFHSWFSLFDVPRRGTIVGVLVVLCFSLLTPFVYYNRRSLESYSFREAGEWLRDHAARDESVFLEPIGLIGYLSKLYVHDYIGLVSPAVVVARKAGMNSNRWFVRYLKDRLPTYVILRSEEIRNNEFAYGGYGDGLFTSEEKDWFDKEYQRVIQTSRGPEIDRLVVYKRGKNSLRL